MKILCTLLILFLLVLMLVGCQATRAGYESAPYRVVQKNGRFQLRDYPALTVVETKMAPGGKGSDDSFGRLFRFITGGNEENQKIAMTTPVFMSAGGESATMAFVMPAKMNSSDVPRPSDSSLAVKEVAAGRFAVLRYSGGRNAKNDSESLAKLQAWIEQEGLKELSAPIYGYFDPPWTPSFLRRNEVMIRIGPTDAAIPNSVEVRPTGKQQFKSNGPRFKQSETLISAVRCSRARV